MKGRIEYLVSKQKYKKRNKNNLAKDFPEIAKQWHPTKNKNLKPTDVISGSTKKVWWKCHAEADHEWESAIRDRVRGNNCPCCSNQKVVGSNCLSTTHKNLSREWHPTKNGDLKPENFVWGSHTKVWWQCLVHKDHEWKSMIKHRAYGSGCPFCNKHKVCKSNSLKNSYPEVANEWNYKKNKNLKPEKIYYGSRSEVWWKCEKGHEWKKSVKSRTLRKTKCPHCRSILIRHPSVAEEWNYEKNNINPENVVSGSSLRVWWKCRLNPNHEWEAIVASRTLLGAKCPYCCNRKITKDNSLLATHPKLAQQWHPTKNQIAPSDVAKGNNIRVWWKCEKDKDHEWQATINNRAKGSNCPFCMGRKASASNCLSKTHPDLVKELHELNEISPDHITAHSTKKMMWVCKKGHQYMMSPNLRICERYGCPKCRSSHGEKRVEETLLKNKICFKRSFIFKNCKDKRPLPFDFVIFDNDVIIAAIEFQGIQHFLPSSFGSKKATAGIENLKIIKKHDLIKSRWCKNNNIPLLKISYKKIKKTDVIVENFIKKLQCLGE